MGIPALGLLEARVSPETWCGSSTFTLSVKRLAAYVNGVRSGVCPDHDHVWRPFDVLTKRTIGGQRLSWGAATLLLVVLAFGPSRAGEMGEDLLVAC